MVWIILQTELSLSAQSQLFINEFMASNVAVIADDAGDYDDWIEIYNSGTTPIDMAGYYISDNPSNLTKYQIPSGHAAVTTIASAGFLLLWADSEIEQGPLHLDFKLSRDSESVLLVDRNGTTILDSLTFATQYTDISFGQYPDGSGSWQYFVPATPAESNFPGYIGVSNPPMIAEASGFFEGAVAINITPANPADQIYYTLDGSDPDENSSLYSSHFIIQNSVVLRASSIRDQYAPSAIVTRHFFIQQEHTLPVLSIVTDPANLFDDEIGIYKNYKKSGRDWERKVNVQYFKDDTLQFDIDAGIRIQGSSSVTMPKKSFRLFFRNGYGAERLEYKLFENSPLNTFQNIVLRAGYDEDLQQNQGTLLRDPLITELWRQAGFLVSHSNFAVLYLNNDFWGIYNVRENVNEYFAWDYGFESDVDLIRYRNTYWEISYGSDIDWSNLLGFFEDNSFDSDEMLAEAGRRIDLDNYTTLHAFGHATQYRSWYYGVTAVKNQRPGSRWQWTIWDMDRAYTDMSWDGFSYYDETTGTYWNNQFISRLLENQNYKEYFINHLSDLLNTLFEPQHVISVLDSLVSVIEEEIPGAANRWRTDPADWYDNVEYLREFIRQRPDVVREQMHQYFGLGQDHELMLDVPGGGGKIRINTVEIQGYPWSGVYFEDIPVNLIAIPADGYRFAGWTDPGVPISDSINIMLTDDKTMGANFERIGSGIMNDESDQNYLAEFSLEQNYPNPFNPATTIVYSISKKTRVKLKVYNIFGQQQAVLVDKIQDAGVYTVEFHSDNYASGIYFYHLDVDGQVLIKKMVLIN